MTGVAVICHPRFESRRRKRTSRRRRGAAVLETAIILVLFLTVVLGMVDLGIGVFRYHILAQAARQGVRRAIVHGELASVLGVWGPATIDVTADTDGVPIVDGSRDGLRPMLIGCDLSATHIRVEWLNGTNAVDEPVRVTVSSTYRPILLFIFPNVTLPLSASSTMDIAH